MVSKSQKSLKMPAIGGIRAALGVHAAILERIRVVPSRLSVQTQVRLFGGEEDRWRRRRDQAGRVGRRRRERRMARTPMEPARAAAATSTRLRGRRGMVIPRATTSHHGHPCLRSPNRLRVRRKPYCRSGCPPQGGGDRWRRFVAPSEQNCCSVDNIGTLLRPGLSQGQLRWAHRGPPGATGVPARPPGPVRAEAARRGGVR